MADFYAPNNNRAPFSHIAIDVTSLAESVPFYEKTLGVFGWTKTFERPGAAAAFGPGYFQLVLFEKADGVRGRTGRGGTHIAFEAPSKQAVHDWYEEAVKLGATANGEPGVRGHLSPNYYAAHVLDPEGYRLEAVYHLKPEEVN
ncbi:Glyoxalase/Bleomycin resistance protein/Dihydroxybiphenyl dioxygenase [Dacryopinax primogenitus]|uniref:Glyoxalase/Bleomycin resistance protein/Dihydroxybiphenyl dioxygenase n=1 Tax=Dacryopinax primogenitus (strain DJM 731) TaxID=1858805 RepID=M5FQG8_DACPD|nr:Glyoxalase/Bleomycin resistance protein/Dihydroxybiphenyl dioxygenase [Dacryopinax primogenitus]EJT99135.1 Glyoxalase/Bleomycin resistance protein/Dihydroxybiphenyl dioxygenase [Dacryopinax primogenitus]